MEPVTVKLDKFKPRDYQLALFDARENKGFKRIMAIWPRRCLSGNTHILMANGSYKRLSEIKVGDEILSWNGSSFVPDTVKNAWKTEEKKTLKVKANGLPEIITSHDHLFLSSRLIAHAFRWTLASELTNRNVICHPSFCAFEDAKSYPFVIMPIDEITESVPEELYDIETEINHNFVANGYVVHNSGKDLTAWNICIRALLRKVQTIYYIFPTFASGRRILWDAINNDGFRILDYLPKEIVETRNEQLMRIRLINGSVFQIIGSDSYNSTLVGTNPTGVVFSEFAISDPMAYSFVRPILSANDGWCMIVSTPRGRNHLWELYEVAKNSEHWFVSKLTVDDTKHISLEEIMRERESGEMSEDLQLQEYWTSFEKGVEGSYYTKYIDRARLAGQIGMVPWDSSLPVHTAWDLGVRDTTAIIFFQTSGQSIRIIDSYEKNKEGLEHYVAYLKTKPYIYGKHIGPHDIRVRELGSGSTRWEKARSLGIRFEVADKISIEDGIEAVRSTFSRLWIDERNCSGFIKAIENYRQEYDSKKRVYKPHPLHNSFSNYADALRYLCVSLDKTKDGLSAQELEKNYREAMWGASDNIPNIFKDDHRMY